MRIKKYIELKLEELDGKQNYNIARELGISSAMLSFYKNGKTTHPSLSVARAIYRVDKIVIYPYSTVAVEQKEDSIIINEPSVVCLTEEDIVQPTEQIEDAIVQPTEQIEDEEPINPVYDDDGQPIKEEN